MSGSMALSVSQTVVVASNRSDHDLVRQAQAGRGEAREELAHRFRQSAYLLALQLLGNRDEALDVAQESMLRFFVSLERFSPDRPVRPWLLTIVRNQVRDLWRRQGVRRTESLDATPDLSRTLTDPSSVWVQTIVDHVRPRNKRDFAARGGGPHEQGEVSRESGARHPAEDAAPVLSRRKDPDRSRGAARRREHSDALSPRGPEPESLLPWSKEFLEAGKKRLVGDTTREATSSEVTDLRQENGRLKQVVAEMVLENRLLKKNVAAFDSEVGT